MKEEEPCADCGCHYPFYVMDFDHLPGAEKHGNLARMQANALTLDRIKAEVAKCEVVCANCHRERTQRRKEER